jgi:single-strand DNA-binding protein
VRGCTRDDPVGGASWGRGDIPEHWPIATLSSSGKYVCRTFTTVNAVVLAGSVAADPVQRRMPSGDEVTELRLSVPEAGKRLLPLPVAAWHATVGVQALDGIAKGDRVLVHGQLVRRFYRSGAGARSLTEVVASGIKKLEEPAPSG